MRGLCIASERERWRLRSEGAGPGCDKGWTDAYQRTPEGVSARARGLGYLPALDGDGLRAKYASVTCGGVRYPDIVYINDPAAATATACRVCVGGVLSYVLSFPSRGIWFTYAGLSFSRLKIKDLYKHCVYCLKHFFRT